jgi:hypothetical protein
VHGADDDRHKVANHLEYSELKQLWVEERQWQINHKSKATE